MEMSSRPLSISKSLLVVSPRSFVLSVSYFTQMQRHSCDLLSGSLLDGREVFRHRTHSSFRDNYLWSPGIPNNQGRTPDKIYYSQCRGIDFLLRYYPHGYLVILSCTSLPLYLKYLNKKRADLHLICVCVFFFVSFY